MLLGPRIPLLTPLGQSLAQPVPRWLTIPNPDVPQYTCPASHRELQLLFMSHLLIYSIRNSNTALQREPTEHVGIYIQVGAKRRIALLLRVEDPETLVFGYEVKSDDRDTDGASVENRYRGTGFLILTKRVFKKRLAKARHD